MAASERQETPGSWQPRPMAPRPPDRPRRPDRLTVDTRPWQPQLDVLDTGVLLELRARLEQWETYAGGDPLAAHHSGQMTQYLAELRTLAAGGPDQRSHAVMLAALALGPRGGGLPGAGDLAPLVLAAAEGDADAVELAIAWGCGWGREVSPEHGWHARWVAAILALSSLAGGSINQAARWLGEKVSGFAQAARAGGAVELQAYAPVIAMELAVGACRCGHGGRGSPAGTCARPEHRLAAWRPEVCSLRAFVATAVRGSALASLRTGAFATSMLSSFLLEDQLVRVDVAEFDVCHACNEDLIRTAVDEQRRIDVSSVVRGLHDIGRCPDCDLPADPNRTYRVGRKNWLIVPAQWGGQHHARHRYRCMGCGNLFSIGLRRCPICRWQVHHRDRLTSVWVRSTWLRHAA